MVLVSHTNQFIFIKTAKTAGTSVEIFLERHCLPPHEVARGEGSAEVVSKHGIVGYRGPKPPPNVTYYNHMSASELKLLLPYELWHCYLKVACIRNPFDQLVSLFWFQVTPERRTYLESLPFSQLRSDFRTWLLKSRISSNWSLISIDDQLAVDFVIRYERLLSDLQVFCERVGIRFEPARLGRFKTNLRGAKNFHFSEYYCCETVAYVKSLCSRDLDTFNYTLNDPGCSLVESF